MSIDLAEIAKIWKWQPPFARPVWIEVGKGGGMSFWLMDRAGSSLRRANAEACDAHVKVVEAAWDAARSRVASHDGHP